MESNRWTSKDQANYQSDVSTMFSQLPPPSFENYVNSLDERLRRLEDRLIQ